MGYETRHNLEVHIGEMNITKVLKEVGEDFNGLHYAIDEYGDSLDAVKWYEHEGDMLLLSERYPELVFELHGEGEENDDMWYKYFKNGKMQHCYAKIVFDEYDESKLR